MYVMDKNVIFKAELKMVRSSLLQNLTGYKNNNTGKSHPQFMLFSLLLHNGNFTAYFSI